MDKWTPKLCLSLLIAPVAVHAEPVVTGTPIFTGHVQDDFNPEADFDPMDLYTLNLQDGTAPDVGTAGTGVISGMDVKGIWLFFDPSKDILYAGMETYGIAGDVDGDGDPGASSISGVTDNPDFNGYESFVLMLDTNRDGIPDYAVGVASRNPELYESGIAQFTVSSYVYGEQPYEAFGDPLTANTGPIPVSPSESWPHVEFTITNFSTLPGLPEGFDPASDGLSFKFAGYMGASDDVGGFGEDDIPANPTGSTVHPEMVDVSFPSPIGSLSGQVRENWADDSKDGPVAGVTVTLTGDFDGTGAQTHSTVTDSDGMYSFEDLRLGSYTAAVVPGFGYEVDVDSGSTPTLTSSIGIQEDVTGRDFVLKPSDSDGDAMIDLVEGPSADTDGDGDPDYQDTDSDGDGLSDTLEAGSDPMNPADSDGDGRPDYTDTDSDDDGLLDGLEGGQDTDGDGLIDVAEDTDGDGTPDVHDLDSDNDGLQDGVEAGVTEASASPDTDTGSTNFVPDADPAHTSDPDDQDTDDDCIPDGSEDGDLDGALDEEETWPDNADTDGDGVQDGTEEGYTEGVPDTDVGVCIPDADGGTETTDPTDADTDDGGKDDGQEDPNGNGQIDEGEIDPNYAPDDTDADGDSLSDEYEEEIGTDPYDVDTDDDGVQDGDEPIEDPDGDGLIDPLDPDSDDDGLQDGTEIGLTEADVDADTDLDVFIPDDDPTTTTDPYDDDSDDDGLLDGHEDDNLNGQQDSDETDPSDLDTDGDCIQDGTELGLTQPEGDGTSADVFVPDADPSTTTDPLVPDTDSGGRADGGEGGEDANCNGAIDVPETNPNDPTDDYTGLAMGGGGFGSCSTAPGSGSNATTWLLAALVGWTIRRRRWLRAGAAATVAVAVAGTGQVRAQEQEPPRVEVQQFHPVEDLAGTLVTSGSATLKPGKFNAGLWVNYANDPLVFGQGGDELFKLQTDVVGLDLGGAVGLLEGVQLAASIPGTAYQRVNRDSVFTENASNIALNDISLRLRLRLLDIEKHGAGVALEPRVWVPAGSPASHTGGQFNSGIAVILDKRLGESWLGVNVGYRYRPTTQNLANLLIDDEWIYRLGVGIPSGRNFYSLDLFGSIGTTGQEEAVYASKPMEVMLGFSRSLRNGMTASLAASTGVIGGYGSPDFRLAAGLIWGHRAPVIGDRDGDGIPDSQDKCPDEPEDKDGFEDEDGCPDIDNDKDGILDVNDKCPNDPEDKDGFEDEDGCPDIDNDKDGILDVNDKCPNDPEDKDGFEDGDGCPDIDNDQDGILDVNDKCPMAPESFNQFEDEDGCPDVKVAVKDVKVVSGKLMLLQKIYFEFDKDVIMPQSFQILNSAITVFKDNPQLRVRIEGHTDAKGSDAYNLDLSARRAASVKRYMVQHGKLDPSRFETQGLGESMPVETNDTEEGRALNRRIEWIIIP